MKHSLRERERDSSIPPVHVGPRFDVVQGVGNPVQIVKKLVVEDVLRLGAYAELHGRVVGAGVHGFHRLKWAHKDYIEDIFS